MRPTRRVSQLALAFPGGLLRPVPVRRRFRRILGASCPHHQSLWGGRERVCVPRDLLKAYYYLPATPGPVPAPRRVVGGDRIPSYSGDYRYAREDKDVEVQLLLFESFGGFGKGVREILRKAADVLQNKLTRAQYLDEVTWTTKNWLGLQKQRISVVLHRHLDASVASPAWQCCIRAPLPVKFSTSSYRALTPICPLSHSPRYGNHSMSSHT